MAVGVEMVSPGGDIVVGVVGDDTVAQGEDIHGCFAIWAIPQRFEVGAPLANSSWVVVLSSGRQPGHAGIKRLPGEAAKRSRSIAHARVFG